MRIFGKLDRYVTSYFLSSYSICFFFFLGLFIIIDLVPKVDEVMGAAKAAARKGDSLFLLTVRFYLLKTPEIFLMVAPYLTVMAAMFSVSRLRKNNELIPMIMAGVSMQRVLLPLFAVGLVLLLGMVVVQEIVAPFCAERRMILEAFLLDHEDQRFIEQEVFWDQEGQEIVVRNYNVATRVISSVDVSFMEQRGGRELHGSIKGKNLRYLGRERNGWSIEEGIRITENPDNPDAGWVQDAVKVLETDLTPRDIVMREKELADLTFKDIRRAYQMNPNDLRMKILLHYHITFPLSNLLLLLLGVPFVIKHDRKSHYLGLIVALLICGGYFVLDLIMRDLGTRDQINPVLAAWFASIFCGTVGIYLFDNIRS